MSRRYRMCLHVVREWAQDWKCHICGTDISGRGIACLDHDHTTGRARGIICRRCNLGLSYLDDAPWMARAWMYKQGRPTRATLWRPPKKRKRPARRPIKVNTPPLDVEPLLAEIREARRTLYGRADAETSEAI